MIDTEEGQPRRLAKAMAHLLAVVDEGLAIEEIPLSERPFRASRNLLQFGFIEVNGVPQFDREDWPKYVAEPWFRAIFTGVEDWYRDHYGAAALIPKSNPPLEGVVVIRGSPFLLHVPMHRNIVEIEGKTAWMYFEAGLAEGEVPRAWLIRGPNFERLSADQAETADADLHQVATSLRATQHHLLGVGRDETQRGLRGSIRSNLESAARRIIAQSAEEFAFAWMDLQMAAESALKLVIVRATGNHPHKHELVGHLLSHPGAAAVAFDQERLATWPRFATISNRRYGKDYMAGLAELIAAYKLILDLVAACVATIEPPLPSGAGLCLRVAPWLVDEPIISQG
jgi:hypothetical protein